MGEWPHCPNLCGPLEGNKQGYGTCPDCGYKTDEPVFRTEPYPWEKDDE